MKDPGLSGDSLKMGALAAKPYAASRSMALLSALSVLAPLTGLVVEMMLAWRYGASATVDAYRIAALLVVVGAQLFFGNLLPHVVVPMFAQYRARDMEQEGWRLAFSLTAILSAVLLAFIAWVWMYTDTLVGLLGPGLSAAGRDEAALLLRCFSLVLLLMAWSGMANAVLYVHRIFWLSSVAQLMPNILVILAIQLAGSAATAETLAFGLLLGYAAMFGFSAYGLNRVRLSGTLKISACFRFVAHEGMKKAMRLSAPLLFGVFIGQWGMIVINRVMSELPPGTLAEFGYAWKMLALVGLLPAGLATVIFPAVSDAHASGEKGEFARLAERALRMTLFLTVPLAALLYVERAPLVGLLFGRDVMPAVTQAEICSLLGILLIGAPAGALSGVLKKLAYSMHDMKLPTITALFSALAITVLVPVAAGVAGVAGVAWAISAITWGGVLLMLWRLIFRGRILRIGNMLRYLGLLVVLCVAVSMPVMAIRFAFQLELPHGSGFSILELAQVGVVCIVWGYLISRLLGIDEAAEIWRYVRWQLRQLPVAMGRSR